MYKILIVEDEVMPAEYLKSILSRQGWQVVDIVDNAADAVKSVNKYSPDLILMDIMIKGAISGCEAAVSIRAICNCRIVFVTAYADREMIEYAADIKADGYILKPYNEQEIVANIAILVSKNNSFTKKTSSENNIYFDCKNNLLYKDKQVVKLGPKSLMLIKTLCLNRNIYIGYEELYGYIWNDKFDLKKLQMLVFRIRKITGKDFIDNIKDMGYKVKCDCK